MALSHRARYTAVLILAVVVFGVAWASLRGLSNSATRPLSPSSAAGISGQQLDTYLQEQAANLWREAGVDPARIPALVQDVRTVVDAFIMSDFPGYEQLMLTKGATPGPRAAATVAQFQDLGLAARTGSRSTADALADLWRSAAERGDGWRQIDFGRARAGSGWVMPHEDAPGGVAGTLSMFDFAERNMVLTDLSSGTAQSAWIRFPVEFTCGRTFEVRLNFVFDPRTSTWHPLRAEVIGVGAVADPPKLLF